MLLRIALALGRTVDELLDSMSAPELVEWLAFYKLEPWGCPVEDYRAGIVAATVANANRGKKGKARKPEDFIPKRSRPSPDEIMRRLKGRG